MKIRILLSFILIASVISSCSNKGDSESAEKRPQYIKKYRDDGTLSSVATVNEEKYAHGVKVNYYSDGKTVHSKVTYDNGRKTGPAIWYYKNGQIFEHTGFNNNIKQGLTKKYYKSGKLMAEFNYDKDMITPGLKEYTEAGALITDYPKVKVREIDQLASENKIILEISTAYNGKNTKYYQLEKLNDMQNARSYIDSKKGVCRMEFFIYPGNVLNKKIEFYAEVPTDLGNYRISKESYVLNAMNLK